MTQTSRLPCEQGAMQCAEVSPTDAAHKRWVLAASVLGSSLAFVDGTVVNVALPAIQRALDASVYQAQWVVESYALLLAALLLVGGALGDRYGRRRVFVIGVALFGVASLLCALSQTVHQLIAARALQGVGGALLVPGSLALISAHFPEEERGRAFGTWAGFSGITSAVGPLLGGWLVDHFSWAWAFAVNLPLVALVLAITLARVPESRPREAPGRLDLRGALLATVGLGGVVFAFIEAPTRGWRAAEVVAALVLGVAALIGFVFAERRHPAPMLPLRLLRQTDFAGANLLTLLLYAALGGGLFYVPLNLIQVQGLSATAAGAALLPFIAILFLLSRWAGGLVDRHGARKPLIVGPLIAGAGFALLLLPGTGASYWRDFLPGIAVLGLGMAIAIAPLTTAVMNAVGPGDAGTASGVNNAMSRVAGLLAIAVFGWIMALVFEPALLRSLRSGALPPGLADAVWEQRARLAAIEVPQGTSEQAGTVVREAVHGAFVAGYRWIMVLSVALAVASAGVAALWVGRGPAPRGQRG
ncbi:DHA2 family efflux MFS transporter permease subunit [Ramlibacter henchirensis]|uniref:DHA2 family efflux MFS transporter permease subunit n=1 Tax=Ramlibacter henchirensis TaxID=204072 RepID=A0A4Z0C7H9_9BURK|nr:DHA2 family efflux MFS transporter permease subunit [Ramlibacter henchirensis]